MKCQFCYKKIPDDSLYCPECGNTVVRCPKCGRVIPEGLDYCPHDGTAIMLPDVIKPTELYDDVQYPAEGVYYPEQNVSSERGNSKKIAIIIAVVAAAVFLMIAIVIFIVLLLVNNKASGRKTIQINSASEQIAADSLLTEPYSIIKNMESSDISDFSESEISEVEEIIVSEELLERKTSREMTVYEQHDYDGDGKDEAFAINEYEDYSNQYVYYMDSEGNVSENTLGPNVLENPDFSNAYACKVKDRYFFIVNTGDTAASSYGIAYGVENNYCYSVFDTEYQYIGVDNDPTVWICQNYPYYDDGGHYTDTFTYRYKNGIFVLESEESDKVTEDIDETAEIYDEYDEYDDEDGIIFPDSSERYLTQQEVDALTDEEVQSAINDLCAFEGRKFKTKEISEFYQQFSWYQETYEADYFDKNANSIFNTYENANYKLLTKERKSRK